MLNTRSKPRRLQRLAGRAHIGPLLFLLSACSGSPVSLGSGLDTEESTLTGTPTDSTTESNGTAVDCAENPLDPACPTAEGCAINPLAPGCPTAEDCTINPLAPGCPQSTDG